MNIVLFVAFKSNEISFILKGLFKRMYFIVNLVLLQEEIAKILKILTMQPLVQLLPQRCIDESPLGVC